MARQLQEIRVFNSGIISNPDETDIPIEAASNSLNIDSISKDGVLTGLPGDHLLAASAYSSINNGVEYNITRGGISSIDDDGAELFLIKNQEGNWMFVTIQ